MKKLSITILLGVVLILAGAISASAVTLITNRCTSTYQLTGGAVVLSGWDTSAVRKQDTPSISVIKYAKNLRTGVEYDTLALPARVGDTIEYRITWSNAGEATADTVNLNDYVPTVFTYITGSETFTIANNCNAPTITYTVSDSRVLFIVRNASGTDSAPAASGEIRFRARVN